MKFLSGPEISPQSGNKARQLVIFLHGLGTDGNDLISLAAEFAEVLPDAHFISPNAPFPCDMAPFGYQWFSLLDRNPHTILEGVIEAAPILDGFITEKLEEHGLDEESLALVGFSQGTMMTLYVIPRRGKRVAGIMGYSGALVGGDNLGKELKSKPPVCLVHGNADLVVPFDSMAMAQHILTENGLNVTAYERPNLGHGIDLEGIEIGKEFLKSCFFSD